MDRDAFHYMRLLKAPSSLAFNISRNGASTSSLRNLFWCLTTLIVQNFFLISKPKSTFFQFKALTLVLMLLGAPEVNPKLKVGSLEGQAEVLIDSVLTYFSLDSVLYKIIIRDINDV